MPLAGRWPLLFLRSGPKPYVRSRASFNNGTTTLDHVLPLPQYQAGDLVIYQFGADSNPTVTWPAGWTQLTAQANGTAKRVEIRYRIMDGSEGSSITLTTSLSIRSHSCGWSIYGFDSGTAPEAGTPATGTSTTPDPPSVTPSWGAEPTLFLAMYGSDAATGSDFVSQPSGYTGVITLPDSKYVAGAERHASVASENPGTFTIGASQEWVANTVVIRAQQTAPPPSVTWVPFRRRRR